MGRGCSFPGRCGFWCWGVVAAIALASAAPVFGQYSVTTLATFNGANGSEPPGRLVVDSGGNLYGTAYQGGANNGGTVFEIVKGSNTVTTLATFPAATNPNGGMVMDANGNLYGTAQGGGGGNEGTVFEMAAGTHALTTLAKFINPEGTLTMDGGGNIYGAGGGGVFEIAAGTHAVSTLASVQGQINNGGFAFDSSGDLYGTTYGGGLFGYGSVFEIAAGTHQLSTVVSFNSPTPGYYCMSGLIADANGNMYGTTFLGGSVSNSAGSVFEIAAGTHAMTTLANFKSVGSKPYGVLVADSSGNLYGTTQLSNAVFKVAAGTHALTSVDTFGTFSEVGDLGEGGMTIDGDGDLYGVTAFDGSFGDGTVFEISPVVPEPGGLGLVAIGAVGLVRRRGRRRAGRMTNR
jgi:uncharacterized repeat protein (TIGR03803 family)